MKGMRFLQYNKSAEGSRVLSRGIIRDVADGFALCTFVEPAPGYTQLLPLAAVAQFLLFPTDGELVAFGAVNFPAQFPPPGDVQPGQHKEEKEEKSEELQELLGQKRMVR